MRIESAQPPTDLAREVPSWNLAKSLLVYLSGQLGATQDKLVRQLETELGFDPLSRQLAQSSVSFALERGDVTRAWKAEKDRRVPWLRLLPAYGVQIEERPGRQCTRIYGTGLLDTGIVSHEAVREHTFRGANSRHIVAVERYAVGTNDMDLGIPIFSNENLAQSLPSVDAVPLDFSRFHGDHTRPIESDWDMYVPVGSEIWEPWDQQYPALLKQRQGGRYAMAYPGSPVVVIVPPEVAGLARHALDIHHQVDRRVIVDRIQRKLTVRYLPPSYRRWIGRHVLPNESARSFEFSNKREVTYTIAFGHLDPIIATLASKLQLSVEEVGT